MSHEDHDVLTPQPRLARRTLLTGTAGILASGIFPAVHSAEPVVLNYIGSLSNPRKEIAEKFRADTGIDIQFTALPAQELMRRALVAPNSFDIAELEIFSLRSVVRAGSLRSIDTRRIRHAGNMVPLLTSGKVAGRRVGDQGTAPRKVLFLEGEKSKAFSEQPTQYLTVIPAVYNADTLGIRPDLVKRPVTSWADLLHADFHGRTAIVSHPSTGIMDAAMVVEALGIHQYADKGNMSKVEIDLTIKTLIEAKKAGQFRALWKDFGESVDLMTRGEVVVQSMWAVAVAAVRGRGVACRYQPLREGYRGWSGGLALPSGLSERKLDAAYEFFNWFLDGWAGAHLIRRGYYCAVPQQARAHLEAYEWDYWMEGKPAAREIRNPYGDLMARPGEVRDGGSFEQRMGHVACWNSLMDENTYLLKKWAEFVAA